jgi:hypothetical protein
VTFGAGAGTATVLPPSGAWAPAELVSQASRSSAIATMATTLLSDGL